MKFYKHQKEGFKKFKDAKEMGIFFEMGLGKSALSIKIGERLFLKGDIEAMLVIAPNDVHHQWATEQLPKWLGENTPRHIICFGGKKGTDKLTFNNSVDIFQICCVNIDTFSTKAKFSKIIEWLLDKKHFIVLDEATSIKNISSLRTQRLIYGFNSIKKNRKKVISSIIPESCKARAILTGTPVTNSPMDLWSMFEFLRPNYFGRGWYSFKQKYCMTINLVSDSNEKILVNNKIVRVPLNEKFWNKIKACDDFQTANYLFGCSADTYLLIQQQDKYEGPYKNMDELKKLIEPVSMFKILTECVDMPEKKYVVKQLTLNKAQAACYKSMKNDMIAEYADKEMTALNKITVMTRLQQICSGFIVTQEYDEEKEDYLPKEVTWLGKSNPKLDALYRDVKESNKPIIIMTRYTAEAARIYDDLSESYNVMLYTGWKKNGTLDEFKEGKFKILVANIAAVHRGFNLQNSSVMLFYSNTFSLEMRLQGEGRIFRIGQKKPCLYVDYVFVGTRDEDIIASFKQNKKLLDYIRGVDIL